MRRFDKRKLAKLKYKSVMKRITPFLWYDGKAQAAAKYYCSIFKNSKITSLTPMSASFSLDGQDFIALNGGPMFKFTEAVSFYVNCRTQKEIDYYWKKLGAGGRGKKCGWLKDKYGLSWQIIPSILGGLIGGDDAEKSQRAFQAMLKMTKLDIKKLKAAYAGK